MNVRIISGDFKGRVLSTPGGHKTHPMSEKLRGALFNTLGDIVGLTVLDVFAGSGAIGMEALSRGAKQVTMIESDRRAQRSITENISTLKVQHWVKLTQAPFFSWSQNNHDSLFDVVIADPPFDDLQFSSLQKLPQHIKSGGVLALNFPADEKPIEFDGLTLAKQKTHGTAQLIFYKK